MTDGSSASLKAFAERIQKGFAGKAARWSAQGGAEDLIQKAFREKDCWAKHFGASAELPTMEHQIFLNDNDGTSWCLGRYFPICSVVVRSSLLGRDASVFEGLEKDHRGSLKQCKASDSCRVFFSF